MSIEVNKPKQPEVVKESPKSPKNRDVLVKNIEAAKKLKPATLKKSILSRKSGFRSVKDSEEYMALAGAEFKEEDKKLSISMDLKKLDEKTPLTHILTPDFENINIQDQTFSRKTVDGKLGYYGEDGKEIPMEFLKGKLKIDISEEQLTNYSREQVEEMIRKELAKDLESAVISEGARGERGGISDSLYKGLYGDGDGGGSGGGGGGSGFESRGGGGSGGAINYGSVAPSKAPSRYKKFEKGVTDGRDALAVNRSADEMLKYWENKYSDYMKRSEVTAQRIESKEAKRSYVQSFINHDIPNAMKFGWSGANQTKPLVITKDRMAYFFVPKTQGQAIDLNNPDTFELLRMPVSTGKGGYGNIPGSNQTPTGLLEATAFQETGPAGPHGINVYRVLLEGRNTGQNGEFIENTNSKNRGILAHQQNLETPSLGCLRFGSKETIFMASQIKQFGSVFINVSSKGLDETPVLAQLENTESAKV